MNRERLKNSNSAPITWQGDKGVTLRVRYEAMGTEGDSVLVAREIHLQFGKSCPVLATIAAESPTATTNLMDALQGYSRGHLLNRRQGITMHWIKRELERSIIDLRNERG